MNKDNNITDWFSRRGITEQTLKEFHVTSNDVSIVIPVTDIHGDFSFNKYRRLPYLHGGPKYSYDKGSRATLYGQQYIKDHDSFVITEGEMDCLVLNSHNIPALSSTGGALTFKDEWVDLLKDKDITVCFDNDEAGGVGMAKMYRLFPNASFVFVPDDAQVKDISDYFQRGGDLQALIATAVKFPALSDVEKHMKQRSANWQQVHFHKAVIKDNKPAPAPRKKLKKFENQNELEYAKAVPITDFIKVNGDGKAKCLWHNEKTPSLHVYEDTNSFYCYGCGQHGDVINVVEKIYNITFKEALVVLNKKR